ncbi:hypothetical protein PR048_019601 [Dryococelus australis]|uniref:Uncharacterized protein n=1 Tax=Dryococelus australis TaxID=614101 RepID=A0ABQ9H414_9NEOP|nr:hypothetical protein PR048_019601 [Dryococelus australis]
MKLVFAMRKNRKLVVQSENLSNSESDTESQFYENMTTEKSSPHSRYYKWNECTPEDIQA